MSHTLYEASVLRVQRCELAVPGSNPGMFEKAMKSGADFVFLDLEDAVAPDDKLSARKNVIEALNDLDWKAHGITVSVRINGLDTQFMVRDVVDLVEKAGDKMDTLLIPKVGVYADVYMVEAMLSQLEMQQGLKNRIGIEALIETALGMANVEDIARSGAQVALKRCILAWLIMLPVIAPEQQILGGLNPDYPGDQWHHAISRMTVPVVPMGYVLLMARLVISKIPRAISWRPEEPRPWVVKENGPSIPLKSHLPTMFLRRPRREIEKAQRILGALKEAAAQGKGAAALDGRLIDAASARMANNVVKMAEAIGARG